MTTKKFYSRLKKLAIARADVSVSVFPLNYKAGKYNFWRLQSRNISRKDKVILICAGIHGEEVSGPLTIYHHFNQIIDYVHKNNLKFILYPLRNPSGFEKNLRYNADHDKGEAGNNDFIRYKLKSGKIVDDLKDKNIYKKWFWCSEKKLKVKLPKETALFHKLLKKDLKYNIVACLDLHQDYITPSKKAAAYHYAFGNMAIYKPIINKIKKIVPLWKNHYIGAGFNMAINKKGTVINKLPASELIKSDALGFIQRFDGTLGDLAYRLGIKYSITAETTGATPRAKAIKVNLLWIKGLVDLIK